jgi:hypothetical protein
MILVNTTVSTTREGVSVPVNGTCGVASITNSTVVGTPFTGWPFTGLSGLLGFMELRNVVIAHQGAGQDCGPGDDPVSLGRNIDSDRSCGLDDPSDLSNVDPLLGPLQNNGGPTPTHALLRDSPAIDRTPSAACKHDHDGNPATPELALTKDQRNGSRPLEGDGAPPSGCDVGAYEVAGCADDRDNDGDGLVDFDGGATAGIAPLGSRDPDCRSALGNSEVPSPPPGCGLGPS